MICDTQQPLLYLQFFSGELSYFQSPGRVKFEFGTTSKRSSPGSVTISFAWLYRLSASRSSRKDLLEKVLESSSPYLSLLSRGMTAIAFTAEARNEGVPGTCGKAMGPALPPDRNDIVDEDCLWERAMMIYRALILVATTIRGSAS